MAALNWLQILKPDLDSHGRIFNCSCFMFFFNDFVILLFLFSCYHFILYISHSEYFLSRRVEYKSYKYLILEKMCLSLPDYHDPSNPDLQIYGVMVF